MPAGTHDAAGADLQAAPTKTKSNVYSERELQTLESAVFTYQPDDVCPF